MKMAMLTTAMPKFSGEAISKNVSVLSKELQCLGHEVKICPLFKTLEEFREFRSSSNPLIFPYYYILSQKRFEDALKDFHPDFMITHFGLLGTNFILPNDIRTIMFVYAYPSNFKDCLFLQREFIRFGLSTATSNFTRILSVFSLNNPQVYRMSLKRSSLAVFPTEDLKEAYGRYAPSSSVLNLAISDDEFGKSEQINRKRILYRQKWNLSEKDTAIGFLGHSSLVKGVDLVVETFANLSRSREGRLRLLLALSPLETLDLRGVLAKIPKSILGNIRIFDYVDSLEFIGVLDLLLFPLRSHIGTTAVPRTILEALLVGTPVVAGNVNPAIVQLYSKAKIGITTSPLLTDISVKSNLVLDDLESFKKETLVEREKILPSYHVKKVAKELIELLLAEN